MKISQPGEGSKNMGIADIIKRRLAAAGWTSPQVSDWNLTVQVGECTLQVVRWAGQQLKSPLSLDTETELIIDATVPKLALASASDGETTVIILPADVAPFIVRHQAAHIIMHNAAFDYHVVRQHLRGDPAQTMWLRMADQGQLHCSLLLAMLVDIGVHDDTDRFRYGLDDLAARYLGLQVDKSDPHRLKFGELLGHDWTQPVDPGYLSYAAADPFITLQLWQELKRRAIDIINRHHIGKHLVQVHGLLTETLQTHASIALADIFHRGVVIDRTQVAEVRGRLEQLALEQVARLREAAPDVFSRTRAGELRYPTPGSLVPSKAQEPQRRRLQVFADARGLSPPKTDKGHLGLSSKYWGQFAGDDPYISAWVELEHTAKLLGFFGRLTAAVIHPRYRALVRTGRTSCKEPNLQQLPRAGGFRQMVVAPAGQVLFGIDYSAIELVVLAHVCHQKFGRSTLRDILRDGVDPHAYVAAIFEGCSLDEFNKLPNRKELRQRAKALNFGIPGGLSADTLVQYAAQTYQVQMTHQQAEDFRHRHITTVFPELTDYLESEPLAELLAWNLQTTPEAVQEVFDEPWHLQVLRRLCNGEPFKSSTGEPYPDGLVERLWEALVTLDSQGLWTAAVAAQDVKTLRRLFWGSAVTLSGRVRGNLPHCASKNCSFQGGAADGAKAALWRLHQAGFQVVVFCHDEYLLAWPASADHTAMSQQVEKICIDAMQPFCGDVPVRCEYWLAKRWDKRAEKVLDANGRLSVWEPPRDSAGT